MTCEQSLEFVKEPARTASYIKYYTDKTKPIVEETGLNPPMIIPDNEMKISLMLPVCQVSIAA